MPYKNKPYKRPRQAEKFIKSKKARLNNVRTGGRARQNAMRCFENKYHDVAIHEVVIIDDLTDTLSIMDPTVEKCLNSVDTGTSSVQRIGRKVKWNYFSFRYQFVLPNIDTVTAGQLDGTTARIIVFVDNQTNKVQATPGSLILETTTPTQQVTPLQFRNLEEIERFSILMDKTHVLRPNAPLTSGASTEIQPRTEQNHAFYKKLDMVTTFIESATPPTIAQIADKSIHVLCVTTSEASSWRLSYNARLRYTD